MNRCDTCDSTDLGFNDRLCSNCLAVEIRLANYLKSGIGREKVKGALEVADSRVPSKEAP